MLLALAIGALLTNLAFKPLVYRPRPYSHDGSIYQQYWMLVGQHTESDFSFPSGHTTAAMAFSTGVFLSYDKRKSWPIFFFAALMGISRMYLSVHYFTDVLGGVVVGLIGGVAALFLMRFIPEPYYNVVVIKPRGSSGGAHLKK